MRGGKKNGGAAQHCSLIALSQISHTAAAAGVFCVRGGVCGEMVCVYTTVCGVCGTKKQRASQQDEEQERRVLGGGGRLLGC